MSKYELDVVDINGETIAFTECTDEEPRELFDTLTPSAGGKIYLKEIHYDANGKYINTEVISKKE